MKKKARLVYALGLGLSTVDEWSWEGLLAIVSDRTAALAVAQAQVAGAIACPIKEGLANSKVDLVGELNALARRVAALEDWACARRAEYSVGTKTGGGL